MAKIIEVKLNYSLYRDNRNLKYAWMYDWEASRLEFKNGVALAHAVVVYDNNGEEERVGCYGLIDENFQEVYAPEKKGAAERYLMFLGFNKNAERFSDNDYLIEVIRRAGTVLAPEYTEYLHIHVEDGVPTLMNVLSSSKPVTTKREGLFIIKTGNGLALYDIYEGKFVTPELVSIKEDEENDGMFNVTLRVTLEESENKFELVDYLFFRIDSTGRIVSNVLSSLENGTLTYIPEGCTIGELFETRKECLSVRESQFGEEVREFDETFSSSSKGETGHAMKMTPVDKK